jgi:hypothetical protein
MATNVRRQQADTQTQWETEITAFKTALAAAVASIAVALGATALTSAPASAKFLPLTHLPPVTQANPGAVPGNIITPGLPGAFGNVAPNRPCGGSAPNSPVPICLQQPQRCG